MTDHELNMYKSNAAGASVEELRRNIDWNKALAEHFDENMNFNGYRLAMDKVEVLKAELARRGRL